MSRTARLLSVALVMGLTATSSANAEWVKSEIKDEMRGKRTTVFSQTATPLVGGGPSATLMVLDKNDGRPGVVFNLGDGRATGCPGSGGSICNVSIKFDDGKVSEELFATDDGKQLIPSRVVAFAGSLAIAKQVYVEVDLRGLGSRQYKFVAGDLDVKVDRSPSVKLEKYELGQRYVEIGLPLKKVKSDGLDACYAGENISNLFGKEQVKKATLCFFDGFFYSAVVIPGTKASYTEGANYLTRVFGNPDPEGSYPSWPNKGDKVLNTNTKSAAYLTFGKNSYSAPFIITDEIISPLAP